MTGWNGVKAYVRLVVFGKEIRFGTAPIQIYAPVVESSSAPEPKKDPDPKTVRREVIGLHASLTVLERELQLIQGEPVSDY